MGGLGNINAFTFLDDLGALPKTHETLTTQLQFDNSRGHIIEETLFRQFAEKLRFPSYFGNNWDALHDCLCDLSWLGGYSLRIVFSEVPELVFESFKLLVDVLCDALESWEEDRERDFEVCFLSSHRPELEYKYEKGLLLAGDLIVAPAPKDTRTLAFEVKRLSGDLDREEFETEVWVSEWDHASNRSYDLGTAAFAFSERGEVRTKLYSSPLFPASMFESGEFKNALEKAKERVLP